MTAPTSWRPAVAADLPVVGGFLSDPEFFDRVAAIPPALLDQAMAEGHAGPFRLLCCGPIGTPEAFAWLSGCDTPGPKIEEFGVLERGRGVGSRVLPQLLAHLEGQGAFAFVWLKVVVANIPAIRLYRASGFAREWRVPAGWIDRNGYETDILRMEHDFT
ncbi:GNAT family N-acetyltransferase [Pseudooceanicola sp. CBS1P-1]|uniref:GNAT family N-acetyltransferase n=1 Tax=Pseudooceanicola albus TaxID=2692189 RepID=A0A6L7FWS6_9RHOB|nr:MULTISPECIES: N-acetyltransferase [Pseudooceanicola]MBT9383463.1 GNAT family N-acetyltransferase [Pseudooceanicola endophyticus]MXN16215.1 GNAT family N-acetyltransferase [Pseudooceanicola albus]